MEDWFKCSNKPSHLSKPKQLVHICIQS